MVLHPEHTYIHLAEDGAARTFSADAFWSLSTAEAGQSGQGWLISEYVFTEDWPSWEMHPEGDEFVYLLSGAVELLLERGDTIERIVLDGIGAVLVPRGVWHTAKMRTPSRMLHVTRGAGTQTRPVS